MSTRRATFVLLVTAVAVSGCGGGGKHESQALKRAKASLAREYGGAQHCTDTGNGPIKCRVLSFKGPVSVLNCQSQRARPEAWRCNGVANPTRAENAFLRRHAPHARSVIHVVSVSRMSVPRSVVAKGQGFSQAPFWIPHAYVDRSRLHGRGPSLYLTINRWQYEEDLVTDTGNEGRTRISRRSGRLLSDYAFKPTASRAWDATTRVLVVTRDRAPSYFGGASDPLSAFERLRRNGSIVLAGPRRYAGSGEVWTVDRYGVPTRFTQKSGAYRLDVRFRRLERLSLTPEMRRELRIGKHPHSRVIHTGV